MSHREDVPHHPCTVPPVLYTRHADTPPPVPNSEYVMFADDIVSYPGNSAEIMARHTVRAIETINDRGKKWKKTNSNKVATIPLGKI